MQTWIRQVCGPEKLLRPLRNGPLDWKCGLKYWRLYSVVFIFKRCVKNHSTGHGIYSESRFVFLAATRWILEVQGACLYFIFICILLRPFTRKLTWAVPSCSTECCRLCKSCSFSNLSLLFDVFKRKFWTLTILSNAITYGMDKTLVHLKYKCTIIADKSIWRF